MTVTSKSNIILITKDEATSDTVKAALAPGKEITLAGVCNEVSELRNYLSRISIHAVIVDIDIDHVRVLYDLGLVLHSYPETYVIVICSSFHKELVLRAMQAGARNFLEKENISKELLGNLEQFFLNNRKKSGLGSVISIFSAGGGCGATTITVNIANELRLLTNQPIMTIDLDTCYGALSQYLGIKSQYGIADVLNRREMIDNHLVQSSAYKYTKDFYVLVSPASQENAKTDNLQFNHLDNVLNACREHYKYTVIDAPRVTEEMMLSLAGSSDIVIIVHQLTVKDVNTAGSYASLLTHTGTAPQKIIALANRVNKRGPLIKLDFAHKAIGLSSFYIIRNSWRVAVKSMIRGQPLALTAKYSGLRSDFKKLAMRLNAYQLKATGK